MAEFTLWTIANVDPVKSSKDKLGLWAKLTGTLLRPHGDYKFPAKLY